MPSQSPKLVVKSLPAKGRCFVSNRYIKSGELLLSAEPFAAVPDSSHIDRLCSNCLSLDLTTEIVRDQRQLKRPDIIFSHNELQENSKKLWWYCSEGCQQQDRVYRQLEEPFLSAPTNWERFKQFTDYTKDYTRLLLRCLIRRRHEVAGDIWHVNDGMLFEKDLEVLCTNRSLFSAERMQEFKTVAEFLFDFVRFIDGEQRMAFTADRLLDLVCQEECNSFGLYSFLPDSPVGEPKYAFGLAIYPQAVYFNHSCAPNVVHHTIGKRQVFYAVRDIAEGEELCAILQLLKTPAPQRRRKELEDIFMFTCQCARCQSADKDPTALSILRDYLCQTDGGCEGVYVPQGGAWQCNACGSLRLQ